MKTRRIFLAALTVMCAMTAATVFTACGDDEDDITQEAARAEIKGIGGMYILSVTEQMAQLCDYTITYYSKDNQLTTEQAAWTYKDGVATWEKTVTSTILPATFGMKVSVKVKDDAQLDGVNISNIKPVKKLLYLQGVTTAATKAWEKTISMGSSALSSTSTTGNKLPEYLELWNQHGGLLNSTYTFDKDGNQLATGTIE